MLRLALPKGGRGLMLTTLLDTRVAQLSDVAQQFKECVVACRHPNSCVLLFVHCLGSIHPPDPSPPPLALLLHHRCFGRNTRSEPLVWNPLPRKHKKVRYLNFYCLFFSPQELLKFPMMISRPRERPEKLPPVSNMLQPHLYSP